MNELRKIKAIAIAKDEAAYLHEWVFHHLYFGFDGVEVVVNRTTDNSIAVLEELASNFDKFSYSSCDWLDLCSPSISIRMQEIAYAQSCAKAVEEGYTHILFIDVDEFWTPRDFKSSIHDFLNDKKIQGSVSFNWVCELGQASPFQPMSSQFQSFMSSHLKTLSKISDLQEMRIHTPAFKGGSNHCMADGTTFIAQKNAPQFHNLAIDSLLDAFIIHRLYRSEVEYLAALVRGNPDSKTRGPSDFKLNRHGYNFYQGPVVHLSFADEEVKNYKSSLDGMFADGRISDEINIARKTVLDRYQRCLDLAVDIEYSNNRLIQQLFQGCTVQPLAKMVSEPQTIDYSVDVVRLDNGLITISGWAYSKWAYSEMRFGVQGASSSEKLHWTRSDRPDVSRAKPWVPLRAGFDVRFSSDPQQDFRKLEAPIAFEIFEADLIQSHQDTCLLYDAEQQIIRHGKTTDLRMKSWIVPIFFSEYEGGEVLAVLINHSIKRLIHTGGKVRAVETVNAAEKNFLFVKQAREGGLFSIKHGTLYAGAAPGGDFYFNRSNVEAWELFKSALNQIGPRISISLGVDK
ncbi:Glycosyl transferase family 2 [Pseudomonas sp. NFACC02]|uniref:glycosyltransferase family 2 protein n=1 Tax=Pseudomonas sp. NFACC02 TaxID=1566250 RepID=UPI0008C61DB1|nr:glycosyltransferase family 2 protein [Pseudomonas sp. NFACC02]SER59983.1 Glycosyl transferase family 2 [Pseudomonas sp. NFACC02]